jgi:hypothetical protein
MNKALPVLAGLALVLSGCSSHSTAAGAGEGFNDGKLANPTRIDAPTAPTETTTMVTLATGPRDLKVELRGALDQNAMWDGTERVMAEAARRGIPGPPMGGSTTVVFTTGSQVQTVEVEGPPDYKAILEGVVHTQSGGELRVEWVPDGTPNSCGKTVETGSLDIYGCYPPYTYVVEISESAYANSDQFDTAKSVAIHEVMHGLLSRALGDNGALVTCLAGLGLDNERVTQSAAVVAGADPRDLLGGSDDHPYAWDYNDALVAKTLLDEHVCPSDTTSEN